MRSRSVTLPRYASMRACSPSQSGSVAQSGAREHRTGSCSRQETGASFPSILSRIERTVYASGARERR